MDTQPPEKWGKTWLLFPFITNKEGFDSAISIANISLDPFGTKPDTANAWLYFYGENAPAEHLKTGVIAPGTVYATPISVIAPGFQRYVI